MKIGEIKIQALVLIFPSADLEYEEESINEAVFALKQSPSYGSYISASVGSINRALAVIESRLGIAPLDKITHLTPNDTVLDLQESIAQIIPYFIKGDLLLSESPSEAEQAFKLFEELLDKAFVKTSEPKSTVYSLKELLK